MFYLFLDRGEGKEKERERNINVWSPVVHPLLGTWPTTQAYALTGNRTSNPLVHRPAPNPLSHTNQGPNNILFLKYFLNLFLERGEGKEKERERSVCGFARPLLGTWPATQAYALTGN